MNELLKKYDWKYNEEDNEWSKDIWTIRFFSDGVEIYNTPRINTPGKYYKCDLKELDLESYLNEIEDLIK